MTIYVKKLCLFLCLFLMPTVYTHAVNIGIGARVGLDLSLGVAIVNLNNSNYSTRPKHSIGAATTIGLFSDIWLLDWLAITPSLNIFLFRNASDTFTIPNTNRSITTKVKNHSIDLDLLLKFKSGWWYTALGSGIAVGSKASLAITPNIGILRLRNHVGLNLIVESGLYIPVDLARRHNFLIALRGAIDLFTFNLRTDFDKAIARGVPINILKMRFTSQVSLSLTLGYVFKI